MAIEFNRIRSLLSRIPISFIRPVQLAMSLVFMSMSILLGVQVLGFGENHKDIEQQSRTLMVESLAVQLSAYASVGNRTSIDRTVSEFVSRNERIKGAALVLDDGDVISRHGDSKAFNERNIAPSLTRMFVPIYNRDSLWGEVQIVFSPSDYIARQMKWVALVGLATLISFSLFLGKVLTQLDPNRVVPSRIETAFDLFSAGVIILDNKRRIVLANKAVGQMVGRTALELTGQTMDSWSWVEGKDSQTPWATTLNSGLAVSDVLLSMNAADGVERLYSVSCAAVGAGSNTKGVLITLDDLTPLEHRNRELSDALHEIRKSKEDISKKNIELEKLATTDPLTGLANRRTLMAKFEIALDKAKSQSSPLSCIMSDIDFFKRVNDTYGHSVGDEVIKSVADIMKRHAGHGDTVGRYGGEEFVMILPDVSVEVAASVAEKIRVAVIAAASGSKLAVKSLSSSFGVAEFGSVELTMTSELIDAADQALYVAKKGGRNRVEIFRSGIGKNVSKEAIQVLQPPIEDATKARVVELEQLLLERDNTLASRTEFDMLTGVPMRTLFLQRVETELVRAERLHTLVGVMSFELRDLDRIVVGFGHAAIDALVIELVARLENGLRSSDVVSELTAEHSLSRITSNEYGVLLTEIVDSASAMIVVTRLKRLLAKPFKVNNENVYVGANIGISLSGSQKNSASAMVLKAIEARVDAASKSEKVSHEFASRELNDASHDYIRLESDLHKALDNNELLAWFQPKFDLEKRQITGMEALLRWQHATRGFVPPDVFVAVAEANGLIDRLSSLVLEKTLEQIVIWRAMGFDELCVSINVSPMQLRAESLVVDTLRALEKYDLPGSCLEIELTETSVLDRPEEVREALQVLRSNGIGISMDDFGTGYTSIALLADLPLDTVKIDRSFVSAISENERTQAVVQSIISMAHALNLRVVGEGVETNEELEILSNFGCNEVQGYLISRPKPAEEITAFLVQQRASGIARRSA